MTDLAPRPSGANGAPAHAPDLLADAMPQLVWIARSDGVVEYYNERIRAYAGARFEAGAWRWEPMIHPDDVRETSSSWAAAAAAGASYEHEHRIRMADGTYRWHLSRAVPVREGADGPLRWYGTATDIHDLRQAQEAVAHTQASLGLAMRGGRMGWWSRDITTNEVTWSAELEEIFGLPPGSFAGNEGAFYEAVHPDDRPLVARAVEEAIEQGTDYVVEFRYRHADGSWRWMEGRGKAEYEAGRPTWLFGIGIDITARRQAEEVRDLFLGMLSHELRTPVTSIYGGAQLLRRDGLDERTRREITDDVVAESERLERLVENLLVLARVERSAELGGRDPVVLRPLVGRVVEGEVRRHASRDVSLDVRLDIEPGLGPALGDEPSIELCLRNLVSNALKYGSPGGPLEIRVRRAGPAIELAVLDRGPGLSDEDAEHMFDLFYRARRARLTAAGAGIGLYVVRALVQAMDGRVWAANREDGGAAIGFTLPPFAEEAQAS